MPVLDHSVNLAARFLAVIPQLRPFSAAFTSGRLHFDFSSPEVPPGLALPPRLRLKRAVPLGNSGR